VSFRTSGSGAAGSSIHRALAMHGELSRHVPPGRQGAAGHKNATATALYVHNSEAAARRAVAQQRPTRTPTRLEQLPRFRLPRPSATRGELSTPATASRRPTHIEPRPKTPFTTTGAPPGHRISRPQAEARESTKGNSEDPAPRHVAPFRRQPHRGPRRPRDSTSSATRAAARFARSREGLMVIVDCLLEVFGEST
jgi:hypothetical protein